MACEDGNEKLLFGGMFMTTTGELRAIVEELELIDIGDAASYLGEEAMEGDVLNFDSHALPLDDLTSLDIWISYRS